MQIVSAGDAHHPRFPFIVIEGIDGSGKTTVAQRLARKLRGAYLRTPPSGFGGARKRVDSGASLPSRYLFYLSSVAYTSDVIRRELTMRAVICDRYIISTLACHRALGIHSTWNLEELDFVQADYTFFLKVSDEQVRQHRLHSRNKITDSDRLLEDEALRERMIHEYCRFPCIEIDTTVLTPGQVVEKICAGLRIDESGLRWGVTDRPVQTRQRCRIVLGRTTRRQR